MNPAINQEISLFREFLDRENELGILIGSHQNTDTYAAALALYLSLSQAGKKVQIISKKEPTVEVSNLVGIDKVKSTFTAESNSKLVVALPYIKGEVEKVLFTEAPNTINFHLTAAQDKSITPFDISDVKLMWEGGAPSALITVGVGTNDEITAVTDPNNAKIVNIDNYQGNTRFGDVVIVDEAFSSLSEITGKIIKDLALPIDNDIAQNILDGVLFATRNFTKSNTSPFAFEAASAAMYQGAVRREDRAPQANTQPRQSHGQDRQSRDQGQDRGGRDQGQDRGGRDQNRGQNPNQRPRVSVNDFPAMHMQGQRPQQSQNQGQGFGQGQDQNRGQQDQRRMNNPQRNVSNNPQRGGQQFGQNRNVDDIRNKIMEETRRPQPQSQPQFDPRDDVQDAQIVDEPQMSQPMNPPMTPPMQDMPEQAAPMQNTPMPEDQPYTPPSNEDIPDDWLMPKVFKSSKNNN